jgi:uncharacterized protein
MVTTQRNRPRRSAGDRLSRRPVRSQTAAEHPSRRPPTNALDLPRRSVDRYVAGVLILGIPTLAIPAVTGLPVEPFLLGLVYVVLLGGAVLTARRSGPDGVRRLFRGVLHWRIGWADWAIVVAAIPIATIAVAVLTGTYTGPTDGWPVVIGNHLFLTFVFGALIVNVFEETAWQGLVQRHLARRHGLLKGATLTAIPFAAVHLPLSFVGDVTLSEALIASAFLLVLAPFMRYVMGRTDHTTGGSLLAVGVMHASFNASRQLDVVAGEWQYAIGLVVVAVVLLLADLRSTTGRTPGTWTRSGARSATGSSTSGAVPTAASSPCSPPPTPPASAR